MLSKDGFKLFGTVFGISIIVGIPMIWICPIVSIIIGILLLAFVIFNVGLNIYCTSLFKKNNKATEEYAKVNGLEVRYVSPELYNRIVNKDGGDLGDNLIVTKKEVTFI